MYALTANFYPAAEPKNNYLGKASLDIANAVRVNNISVFMKEGSLSLSFSEYGDNGNSFFVPKSKEVYAAILGVIDQAVHAEGHFGFAKGDYGLKFEATGHKVDEPYADGRYSVNIGDFGTLNGITTRWVESEKNGKKRSFVGVNLPVVRDADGKVRMYQNAEGKDVPSFEFQALVAQWTDKEGKQVSYDYGVKLADSVKKARKELYPEKYVSHTPRKGSIDDQVKEAQNQQKAPEQRSNSKNKSKSTSNKKKENETR